MESLVAIVDPDPVWTSHLASELQGLGLTPVTHSQHDARLVIRFVPRGATPPVLTNTATPTIVTTDHDDPEHRLQALSHGAGDYVVKPCSMRELALRSRALLRRTRRTRTPLRTCGPLRFDPTTSRAWLHDAALYLTPLEHGILRLLLDAEGRLVSREAFLECLWDDPFAVTLDAVDGRVRSLRRKLGDEAWLVQTVRGVGYRLARPEHRHATA